MVIRCKTLKNRLYGWIVDHTVDDCGYGRIRDYWELVAPDDGRIEMAFRVRKDAVAWAKAHPFK